MATPSHVDLSVLWVPIMPETSKMGPAMAEAGKEAKTKFDESTKDIGKPINDNIGKIGKQASDTLEQAGKQGKDKFDQSVKDIGKPVNDELDKVEEKTKGTFSKVGSHAKDAFSKAGKVAADAFHSEWGKEITGTLAEEVPQVQNFIRATHMAQEGIQGVSNILARTKERNYGAAFNGVTTALEKAAPIAKAFGVEVPHVETFKEGLQGVSNILARAKERDFGSAFNGVVTGLQKAEPIARAFGIDISQWPGELQQTVQPFANISQKATEVRGHVNEFAGTLKDMPGIVGRIGEGFGKWAGPIAIAASSAHELINQLDKMPAIHDRFYNPDGSYKSNVQQYLAHEFPWLNNQLDPHAPPDNWANGTQSALPPSAPNSANPTTVGGIPIPGLSPGQSAPRAVPAPAPTGGVGGSFGHPGANGGPSGPDSHFFGGGGGWHPVAPVPAPSPEPAMMPEPAPAASSPSIGRGSAFSAGGISSRADLHAAGSRVANLYAFAQSLVGTPYSQQLRNDCSGMVSQLASVAIGLPAPSAGNRFTTVNEGEWLRSHGFHVDEGPAPAGALKIGWYDHGGGNAGHTAATLPGGEHAESGGSHGNFLIGPGAAGADDPQFEHHAWLAMDGSRGKSGGNGKDVPLGTEHDPIYVSQSASSSGGSPFESQGQQLGQGMVSGILQSFGLDGSVFKGFGGGGGGLLNFGALKLGSGLINTFLGMGQRGGGGDGAAAIGGGDGAILPGLGALIPNVGAAISASAIPQKVAAATGGGTTINNTYHGDVGGYNVYGVGTPEQQKEIANSSNRPTPMIAHNSGGLPNP